jgi:hypothetical protein
MVVVYPFLCLSSSTIRIQSVILHGCIEGCNAQHGCVNSIGTGASNWLINMRRHFKGASYSL